MLLGEELTKKYGNVTVLDRVSVCIEPGKCLAIVGENGCGKSTLLSLLAMAQQPDGGRVTMDGWPQGAGREHIGYMPQDIALFDELTAMENLRCFCRGRRAEAKARIDRLSAALQLEPLLKKPVGKLSGGQRRKVSFAVALVNEPAYLLLDEPFAGVDQAGEQQMLALVRDAMAAGAGAAIVVHHPEALTLPDAILTLDHGREVFRGSPAAFLRKEPAP